jgi:hypothetical protein
MSEYIPFQLDDESNKTILIEVTTGDPQRPVYRGEGSLKKAIAHVGEQAKISLNSAMENVQASAEIVLSKLKETKIIEKPSKIELEFGIKLDATAGAIIAQTGAEVNYTVKLTWENPPKETVHPSRKVKKSNISR